MANGGLSGAHEANQRDVLDPPEVMHAIGLTQSSASSTSFLPTGLARTQNIVSKRPDHG